MHAIEARENRNAFSAALGMHLALMAGLLISLNWSRQPPKPVQAELWSGLAPIATAISKRPEPQKTPEPKPVPKAAEKADISLEKKKQEIAKAEALKKEAERKEAERKEAERKEVEKKLAEQKKRDEARAKAKLEERRKAELARLGIDPNAKDTQKGKDIATKSGLPGGAELGAKTGELADYAATIRARVLARIRFDPARAPNNPEVIFMVEQLPTGEISAIRKTKSSGVPSWDDAVERAIKASDPLPKKKDGSVERNLELRFRPLEDR